MKIFILTDDLTGVGPVWLNILWPQINAISQCVDTHLLAIPPAPAGTVPRFEEFRLRSRTASELCKSVEENLDPNGPNILLVWTAGARNVIWSTALEPVWSKFSHHVLNVCDTLQPDHVKEGLIRRFGSLYFPCADQAKDFERNFGLPSRVLGAHSDVLNFHSTDAFRPVDMIVVGRRDQELHDHLFDHFLDPSNRRLFLDFMTRTQGPRSCKAEFEILMSGYARSQIAFCYEAGSIPRFRGRSPLLARWVHAWSAGCTVVGTRPKGTGVSELVDWPEAIIDLPQNTGEAIEVVEEVLSDRDGLARRRFHNVAAALEKHDTRLRLRSLLADLGIAEPQRLRDATDELARRANDIRALSAKE